MINFQHRVNWYNSIGSGPGFQESSDLGKKCLCLYFVRNRELKLLGIVTATRWVTTVLESGTVAFLGSSCFYCLFLIRQMISDQLVQEGVSEPIENMASMAIVDMK